MKITVITVAYNAVDTTADTINSVAGQAYLDVEHIIIDGASTDGTLDIIEQYRDKITKFVSELDRGIDRPKMFVQLQC
jgi:glycosyltransferase involved in cell wall biosynthesis